MSETNELKKIKKLYGERFKNLCRDMFPVILEQDGKLLEILEKKFSNNCNSLYEVITENDLKSEFKDLIYGEFDLEREEEKEETKTPYQILDEVGYNLYECKTEEEIQSFRKYYRDDEVLCTISTGGRLKTSDCFWAVKKNVEEIKRENFEKPQKGDEYSTSVLGIQFIRERNSMVQIISRYNHTVPNPNCTLNNNLDNLAPGLSQSFKNLLKERGMEFEQENNKNFEIPGYTLDRDGKFYKYNYEIDGKYYCPGNIVIKNGEAKKVIEPAKGIVIDFFCLDFENKKIESLNDIKDSFTYDLGEIEKVSVEKSKKDGTDKVIKVYIKGKEEPVLIGIDEDNRITEYANKYILEARDHFLARNKSLIKLNMPNLQEIRDDFLYWNKSLTELDMPNLQEIGDNFLDWNESLTELDMPKLQKVGNGFLASNKSLTKLVTPNLQKTEDGFLMRNKGLTELNMPNLQKVGNYFLRNSESLTRLNMPNLQEVGNGFLISNRSLTEINAPKLQKVGNDFLADNKSLTELDMPELQEVGKYFLADNKSLTKLNMPELQKVGNYFLASNKSLTELNMPKLQEVGDYFLVSNESLTELNIPNSQKIGDDFLSNNEHLSTKQSIVPLDIVLLDKETELTTVEVGIGRRTIEENRSIFLKENIER